MTRFTTTIVVLTGIAFCLLGCEKHESAKPIVRIGHFPNVTHAQGLIAHNFSREGKGWFEERLGDKVDIQWFVYNAGPSAMEAFFAGSIDVTYVGPNPALNAHLKSKGEEVRILSGAAFGGAALVVREDANIASPVDLRGKKIATPQFGNTQDVACRAWLSEQGFEVTKTGGEVLVIPTANPDQLALFQRGQIDGVWTVEPWVSRLEMEAGGKVFLEEENALTTVFACRTGFLEKEPELARKLHLAHLELTQWIQDNPEEARRRVVAELTELSRSPFPLDLVEHAWPRLNFTGAIETEDFTRFMKAAQKAGFLQEGGDLSSLVVEVPK